MELCGGEARLLLVLCFFTGVRCLSLGSAGSLGFGAGDAAGPGGSAAVVLVAWLGGMSFSLT